MMSMIVTTVNWTLTDKRASSIPHKVGLLVTKSPNWCRNFSMDYKLCIFLSWVLMECGKPSVGYIAVQTPNPDRIVLCGHTAPFPDISVNTQKKGLVIPGYDSMLESKMSITTSKQTGNH